MYIIEGKSFIANGALIFLWNRTKNDLERYQRTDRQTDRKRYRLACFGFFNVQNEIYEKFPFSQQCTDNILILFIWKVETVEVKKIILAVM